MDALQGVVIFCVTNTAISRTLMAEIKKLMAKHPVGVLNLNCFGARMLSQLFLSVTSKQV